MARQSSSPDNKRFQAPRSLRSISGWHFLAAVEIFARRYESMLSGVCSIAIVMLWFVSFGTDWLDHLVFGYLLQDLVRHERDTDAIGNHFTINIAATVSIHAAHKLFPALFTGYAWTMLTFFSPLVFDNAILQLWMQRQISRSVRLDRDLRRLSLMLVERSVLIVSSFSHSPWMRSLKNAICWLCYEIHAQMALNSSRKPVLMAIWWHYGLCQSIAAASALLLTSYFWFLAKSISPDPSDHKYSKFTRGKIEFRVLLLYPRLAFWPIRCSLVHIPHTATVWYEAMSYTWGDGTRTETILLDGCTKKVTRSVYEILARQSSIFMPKLLWIDGLCIDQDNEEEKKFQVTHMNTIYLKATLVTVFLCMSTSPSEHERRLRTTFQYRYDGTSGLSGDKGTRLHYQEARLATDLLNEIKVLEKKFKYNEDDDRVYKSLSRPISREQRSRWEHLLKLLQHPLFERVWVVQEVALAKCVRIIYGDEVIIWDRFVSSLKTLQKNHRFGVWLEYWHGLQFRQHSSLSCINRIHQHRETFQACSEWSYTTMKLLRIVSTAKLISDPSNAADMEMLPKMKEFIKEIQPHIKGAEEILKKRVLGDRVPPTLSRLLADGFYFKATNPRDLIYGLMAICNDPLEIDYAISVEKVYLAATKAILERDVVHLLLHASGIGNRRQVNQQTSVLPSWVPDWRSPLKYERLLDQGENGKWTEFTAGGTLPSNLRLIGESTLALSGLPVDLVERLWTLSSEDDYQDSKRPFAGMFGLAIAYFKILSELLGHLENSDPYLHIHPPQSLLEAFRRTLITDKKKWSDGQTVIEVQSLYDELEDYIEFFELFRTSYTDNVDSQLLFKTVLALTKVMEPVEVSCGGRQFFTSKKGYFGLCPPYTLKGDLIYVVPGLYAPIALRPVSTDRNDTHNKGRSSKRRKGTSSKKFYLVGECYVHGLMRGEALSLRIIEEEIEIV